MDVLQKRLGALGLCNGDADFEFIVDDDEDSDADGYPHRNSHKNIDTKRKAAVHVKTLIWEANIISEDLSDEIDMSETSREEVSSSSPCGNYECLLHFATALRHQDRVDEDSLKQRLAENLPLLECSSTLREKVVAGATINLCPKKPLRKIRVVNLKLAETNKAEELAGYMSGTIPPFGHTTPLLLIIDRRLQDTIDLSGNGESRETPTKTSGNQRHHGQLFDTGSGSFRHSLRIGWDRLLYFAKTLGDGVCIASISVSPSLSNQQSVQSVEVLGKEKLISSQDDTDDRITMINGDDKIPRELLPPTTESLTEEMQSLGKLLRDACLREGKAKVIRTVIAQAGDRFPQVRYWKNWAPFSWRLFFFQQVTIPY